MEGVVALEFIGGDPDSVDGQSPAVAVDTERGELVLQLWKADATADLGGVFGGLPEHETRGRLPARMIPLLRAALDRLEELDGADAPAAGT
ncbi:hypothetical protein OHR68_07140 [Spirillospora sp. NBC_00431]